MHVLIEPLFVLVFVAFLFSLFACIDAARARDTWRFVPYLVATALTVLCALAMVFHL